MRDMFINRPFFYSRRKISMLVLGRKPGEYVVIGDNIKIKIVKSENGDLRLAIDAPKDVKITRGEVWEEQQKIANYQTKL